MFGGGGHTCAAGLSMQGETAEFYAHLVAAISAQMAAVDTERNFS